MTHILPAQALSQRWHQEKYAQPTELLRCDTQRRVAHALAQVEPVARRAAWAKRFEVAMRNGPYRVVASWLVPAFRRAQAP